MDWTNWCRLCGCCEVMIEIEPSCIKMIQQVCLVIKLILNKFQFKFNFFNFRFQKQITLRFVKIVIQFF